MSGKSASSGMDRIPTYEESTSASQAGVSVSARIANARQDRVRVLVHNYIDPLLQENIEVGLHRSVVVIIPSDIRPLQDSANGGRGTTGKADNEAATIDNGESDIVGFEGEDSVKLIWLSRPADKSSFWMQPSVIAEIDSVVKQCLMLDAGSTVVQEEPPLAQPADTPQPSGRRKLLSRKPSQPIPEVGSFPNFAGTSATKASKDVLGSSVSITSEEISMRTVSDMGLYEIKSGRGLVVRVHIGS